MLILNPVLPSNCIWWIIYYIYLSVWKYKGISSPALDIRLAPSYMSNYMLDVMPYEEYSAQLALCMAMIKVID